MTKLLCTNAWHRDMRPVEVNTCPGCNAMPALSVKRNGVVEGNTLRMEPAWGGGYVARAKSYVERADAQEQNKEMPKEMSNCMQLMFGKPGEYGYGAAYVGYEEGYELECVSSEEGLIRIKKSAPKMEVGVDLASGPDSTVEAIFHSDGQERMIIVPPGYRVDVEASTETQIVMKPKVEGDPALYRSITYRIDKGVEKWTHEEWVQKNGPPEVLKYSRMDPEQARGRINRDEEESSEEKFAGIMGAVYGGALDNEHPELRADMVWLVEYVQMLTRLVQRKDAFTAVGAGGAGDE